MIRRAAVAFAAALFAGDAAAAALPPIAFFSMGFHEVTSVEPGGAPGRGGIALTTDLIGDGRADEVRVLLNPTSDGALLVIVSTSDKADTYMLCDGPVADGREWRVEVTAVGDRSALNVSGLDGAMVEQFDGKAFRTAPDRQGSV